MHFIVYTSLLMCRYRMTHMISFLSFIDLDETSIIYSTGPQMISDALFEMSSTFTLKGVVVIHPDQRVFENKVSVS